MKTVKVNPLRIYKVTDEVIESTKQNVHPETDPRKTIKEVIKSIKRTGSGHFIVINPNTKELFSIIPIIDNEQFFVSAFPDPIQIYYSMAFMNYQFSLQTRKNIIFQRKQNGNLNFISSYLYNCHLQYKISTVIFLHSTVEAFINYIMPEEFIYIQEYQGSKSDKFLKQLKEYNKEQSEKYVLFKEKLSKMLFQLTKIDFKLQHKKIYDKLLNLNLLRNDLIHLRSVKTNNQEHFHKVFEKVIDVDLKQYIDCVRNFINILKPGFIVFDEINSSKQQKFKFNFESHKAFKTDISIFLKILDVPTQKVVLEIPKSNDKSFQMTLNWIMQNLDVLANDQLIYFPTINDRSKNKITIEIIKTEKKIGEKNTL